jgi:dTDP-4-dehydrorhamnose 3,5-epimerase
LNFVPTPLAGSFLIEIDRKEDTRGFFARLWCREEFEAHGIAIDVVQASVSHNAVAGTLRGMHFQWPPSREAKLVRCERGRVYDVIIDLRPDSPTFTHHFPVTLDGERRNALYIPSGFAHGFQTLAADSDVIYMMSDFHRPDVADGLRFDDPAFGIDWPLPVTRIIERDRNYPNFDQAGYLRKLAQGAQPSQRVQAL